MKQGRTLQELAIELERQADAKRDFLADTRKLDVMFSAAGKASVVIDQAESFALTNHATRQVGERLAIPAKFWDLMAGGTVREREALCEVVNARLHENPQTQLVRTMDGNARAYLSDRYRILDNAELARFVLPALQEAAEETGLEVASCDVTERKLYLKFIFPKREGEVKVGDVVQAGCILRNSEIGDGSLSIYPFTNRLVCSNGMVMADYGMRKFHVGRANDVGERAAYELFSDEALQADDKAFWLKTRDVLRQLTSEATFEQILNDMRRAADVPVHDPVAAVAEVTKRYGLTESANNGILKHLSLGGDMSQWGMANAVTAYSQEVDSYDDATWFEDLGGKIIDLTPKQFKVIGEAEAA